MTQAPRWPAWAVPAVLLGAVAVLLVAGALAVLVGALAGAGDVTPATVLLGSALTLAGLWVLIGAVARRAEVRFDPGLRRIPPRMTLVMLGFGTVVALVAAGATALLADVDLAHPEELGGEEKVIGLDAATAAVVLARAVVAALAIELLVRSFLLPALAQRAGTPLAVAVLAVVPALAGDLTVAPALTAIGVALSVMYLQSGSVLPGVALQGAVQGFLLGVAFDWTPPEAAVLAAVAAAVAYGLARSWDPDPDRS